MYLDLSIESGGVEKKIDCVLCLYFFWLRLEFLANLVFETWDFRGDGLSVDYLETARINNTLVC